jgi:hypothetical protein
MRAASLIAALAGALALTSAAPASAFDVTTTADSGVGSLRAAIDAANANPGTDTIAFADLGATPKIAPLTALPTILESVTIDGYTHPGASPNTLAAGSNAVIKVELSGENLGAGADGLVLSGGGSIVRGLIVNRFQGAGIIIPSPGGNLVDGNFIGTDRTGSAAAANGQGVRILFSDSNLIGGTTPAARNVIAGNTGVGVDVLGGGAGVLNTVNGNYVGVTKTGLAALPNGGDAIHIFVADDTGVGDGSAAGRNVIAAAPGMNAIHVSDAQTDRTRIRGNYIGTNRSGTATLGDMSIGTWVQAARDTTIDGNVIAGASVQGVLLQSSFPASVVQGNRIGTNAAGTAALPNMQGIAVQAPGHDLIGGTDPGDRNLLSGNQFGIVVFGDDVTVQGYYIGTDVTSNAPLPNTTNRVYVDCTDRLRLDSDTAAARNVISGNARFGAFLAGLGETVVEGNYVGIGANGVTPVGNGGGVVVHGTTTGVQIGGATATAGAPPGNVISGNDDSGLTIRFASEVPVVVGGNLVGTNATGNAAVGNGGDGISVSHGAEATQIGLLARNVISGNEQAGVYLGDSRQASVSGNYIGLNRAGTAAVPNATGVELAAGARENSIGSGSEPGNVISGNRDEGVFIHGGATTFNFVTANRIGTRADGMAAVPNRRGVVVSGGAFENFIGNQFEFDPVANTISGNTADGVLITGAETNRNLVFGNLIGTRGDNNAALPNATGVTISGGARQNTVQASTVSGNTTAGVRIAGAETFGNRVASNRIGVHRLSDAAIPNGTGVIVTAGAQSSLLRANRIARNKTSGVLVDGATTAGAQLTQNRIFGNAQLGINLQPAAEPANTVTPNDAGDGDTGPNELQNFPLIAAAAGAPSGTSINGTLNSRPSERYRIEVFRNPAGSGAGSEGETYAGAVTVTTDAAGDAAWSLNIPGDRTGEVLRATATRLSTRDTSELSALRVVS